MSYKNMEVVFRILLTIFGFNLFIRVVGIAASKTPWMDGLFFYGTLFWLGLWIVCKVGVKSRKVNK